MNKHALLILYSNEYVEKCRTVLNGLGYECTVVKDYFDSLQFLSSTSCPFYNIIVYEDEAPWQGAIAPLYPMRLMSGGALVLVLHKGCEHDRAMCLEVADACLCHPFNHAMLHECLTGLLRDYVVPQGSNAKKPHYYCRGLSVFPENHRVFYGWEEIKVTKIEYDMLLDFIMHRDQILSREKLRAAVWKDYYTKGSESTLTNHLNRLRHKIEDLSSKVFIETVRGFGYRFLSKEPGESSNKKRYRDSIDGKSDKPS